MTRDLLKQSSRWVIKIGSSLLRADDGGIHKSRVAGWVKQLSQLATQHNVELILVSSGSVAVGMGCLGWVQRPTELHLLQAAAAVGQVGLVQTYQDYFSEQDIQTAQVLLTHEDLSDRSRYLNARTTLKHLLALGVVPVINENDTVACEELRFGDNDTLAALVANLIEADALIILTDQAGLYDADPRQNPGAQLIPQIPVSSKLLQAVAKPTKGGFGSGGMATKAKAAALAARSGALTVIAPGAQPDVLSRLYAGEALGTLVLPDLPPLAARKKWLAGQLQPRGYLHLDPGAVARVVGSGSSLLSVGVESVQGDFKRGDAVACIDQQGQHLATGLVNYSSEEAARLVKQPSHQIKAILGYAAEEELIHRDNMVVLV